MKALFAALALVFAAPLRAAGLPSDIVRQVPDGYDVMTYVAGLLDGDELTDYLVVAHRPDDSRARPSTRPLLIRHRYFTVQNAVACGQHWSYYITFHYDARRNNWLFHRLGGTMWNPKTMTEDPFEPTRADRRHPVTFAAWRPKNG